MAEIHTLCKDGKSIYPITHISAVVDDNGNTIDKILPTKVSLLENDSGYITEIPDTIASKEYVENAILNIEANKQNTLISGTNIKTINGESILGEGNISVSGGIPIVDSESSLDPNAKAGSLAVVSEEEIHSFGEIKIYPMVSETDGTTVNEAELTKIQSLDFQSIITLSTDINNGIMLIPEGFNYTNTDTGIMVAILITGGIITFMYASISSEQPETFSLWDPTSGYNLETIDLIETRMSGKNWYLFGNMFGVTLSDEEVLILDQIVKFKETNTELYIKRDEWVVFEKKGKRQINCGSYYYLTATLAPNTFYVWGEISKLNILLAPETPGIINEYIFLFTSGETATSLTFPSDIKWASDPIILPNKIYLISILNELGSILLFDI